MKKAAAAESEAAKKTAAAEAEAAKKTTAESGVSCAVVSAWVDQVNLFVFGSKRVNIF